MFPGKEFMTFKLHTVGWHLNREIKEKNKRSPFAIFHGSSYMQFTKVDVVCPKNEKVKILENNKLTLST